MNATPQPNARRSAASDGQLELSDRRRLAILAICCMSLLIVAMDNTIVNVALPSIRRDLHASLSGLQWTIDAYVIVIASLLLLSGSTADRLGRKRTFQVGLSLFVLGSLLCSLAPSLGWLIAARALQGVGGSMLNPVAMSIITNVFTHPRERARAIGAWGAVVGISLALGPIVGGALTESVGWRAIFWINVPIGLAAIALTALYRARVAGIAGAAHRPCGSSARDRDAGVADVRDHRGPELGLVLGAEHRHVRAGTCGVGELRAV